MSHNTSNDIILLFIIAKPTPDLNWLVRLEQRLHKPETHEFLKRLHPIQRIEKVSELVDAVPYLTEATLVTGEVLHVDGGGDARKWYGEDPPLNEKTRALIRALGPNLRWSSVCGSYW